MPETRSPEDLADALATDLADPKPWWQSGTLRGLFVAVFSKVLGMMTLWLIARGAPPEVASALSYTVLLALVSLAGDARAWYGRVFGEGGSIDLRRVFPWVR